MVGEAGFGHASLALKLVRATPARLRLFQRLACAFESLLSLCSFVSDYGFTICLVVGEEGFGHASLALKLVRATPARLRLFQRLACAFESLLSLCSFLSDYGFIICLVVGEEGFEPPVMAPKATALPLGYSPKQRVHYTCCFDFFHSIQ